jgi:hypothetical protein
LCLALFVTSSPSYLFPRGIGQYGLCSYVKCKETFNLKCAACFHGTKSPSLIVSRKRKQPALRRPSSKRISKVPDAKPSFPPLPRVARPPKNPKPYTSIDLPPILRRLMYRHCEITNFCFQNLLSQFASAVPNS